jgi:hypothetical protein
MTPRSKLSRRLKFSTLVLKADCHNYTFWLLQRKWENELPKYRQYRDLETSLRAFLRWAIANPKQVLFCKIEKRLSLQDKIFKNRLFGHPPIHLLKLPITQKSQKFKSVRILTGHFAHSQGRRLGPRSDQGKVLKKYQKEGSGHQEPHRELQEAKGVRETALGSKVIIL